MLPEQFRDSRKVQALYLRALAKLSDQLAETWKQVFPQDARSPQETAKAFFGPFAQFGVALYDAFAQERLNSTSSLKGFQAALNEELRTLVCNQIYPYREKAVRSLQDALAADARGEWPGEWAVNMRETWRQFEHPRHTKNHDRVYKEFIDLYWFQPIWWEQLIECVHRAISARIIHWLAAHAEHYMEKGETASSSHDKTTPTTESIPRLPVDVFNQSQAASRSESTRNGMEALPTLPAECWARVELAKLSAAKTLRKGIKGARDERLRRQLAPKIVPGGDDEGLFQDELSFAYADYVKEVCFVELEERRKSSLTGFDLIETLDKILRPLVLSVVPLWEESGGIQADRLQFIDRAYKVLKVSNEYQELLSEIAASSAGTSGLKPASSSGLKPASGLADPPTEPRVETPGTLDEAEKAELIDDPSSESKTGDGIQTPPLGKPAVAETEALSGQPTAAATNPDGDSPLPAVGEEESPGEAFSKEDKSAPIPPAARRAIVDQFLQRCNRELHVGVLLKRKHIWGVAGHKHARQFQYWQLGSAKATVLDDLNFRRILHLAPTQFLEDLRKKRVIPTDS